MLPVPTSDLELIHGNTAFPGVQAVVHAQGFDDVHSRLADPRAGLGHDKGLHSPILPLHHMHPYSHSVGALLAPALVTKHLKQADRTEASCCKARQVKRPVLNRSAEACKSAAADLYSQY